MPVLLYASETWTLTNANLNRFQAFHMLCQRQILGVMWFYNVNNNEIINRTKLPHIGDIIQKRRHSLFGHVVQMGPRASACTSLKLARDMSMGRRIPYNWRRSHGRPRLS